MINWLDTHPELCRLLLWPILTAVFTALFKPRTAEEYARLPPRLAAFLRLVSALGIDAPKLVQSLAQIVTGKRP